MKGGYRCRGNVIVGCILVISWILALSVIKKKPKDYQWAIELDGKLIGMIGFNERDFKNEQRIIGYWIGKPFRGKGYMTKALKLILKESDKKFNLKRIVGYVYTFNPSSERVLEKCGFKFEGIRKKVKKFNNKFFDDKIYARIK